MLQSADPNVKLNYLLQQQAHDYDVRVSPLILLSTIAVGLLGGLACVNMGVENAVLPRSLFPRSHFTIGKGAERYQKHLRLRSTLLWVVFVGLIVNVLAGVILLMVAAAAKVS